MKFLTNKYLLAACFFAVWLMFFDHNDLILQYKRSRELREVREKADYYREKISNTRKEVEGLRVNTASLEKVAREKYLMKKDNEDLFVIDEK